MRLRQDRRGTDIRTKQNMMKRCIFLPLLCAGDYRKMVENAICALSMAMVLGEAVPTCYLFSQLALAHVALQEFRKAEAYARTAIDVAEGGCSMHQLMSVENPLAPPPPGTYVATQFESAAADALLLAFDRKNDSFVCNQSVNNVHLQFGSASNYCICIDIRSRRQEPAACSSRAVTPAVFVPAQDAMLHGLTSTSSTRQRHVQHAENAEGSAVVSLGRTVSPASARPRWLRSKGNPGRHAGFTPV
jgi:hypothetical protein